MAGVRLPPAASLEFSGAQPDGTGGAVPGRNGTRIDFGQPPRARPPV